MLFQIFSSYLRVKIKKKKVKRFSCCPSWMLCSSSFLFFLLLFCYIVVTYFKAKLTYTYLSSLNTTNEWALYSGWGWGGGYRMIPQPHLNITNEWALYSGWGWGGGYRMAPQPPPNWKLGFKHCQKLHFRTWTTEIECCLEVYLREGSHVIWPNSDIFFLHMHTHSHTRKSVPQWRFQVQLIGYKNWLFSK